MDPFPVEAGTDPFRDDRSFEYTVDHRVDPAARQRFLTTMAKLAEAESRWPGFLAGRPPQRLRRGPVELWRSRIRWHNLESWLAWMESEERQTILREAQEADGFRYAGRTNWQGYARWLVGEQAARTPIWKSNLLVLLVLYPTVMLLAPLLRNLPLERPGAVLLSTSLSVAITGWWLTGRASHGQRTCSLLSILLALALMWSLLERFAPGN
jgi:antibiotic biosynthesis monooxygenase (ABM) superfamily enzyme